MPAISNYNYEPTFRYVKPYIEQADIAIANLEVTLAGPPYKGYPQFSSPDALAIAARDAGFDVFIQANNHALDRGKAGFKRTLHDARFTQYYSYRNLCRFNRPHD